jgi:hypothetical protein
VTTPVCSTPGWTGTSSWQRLGDTLNAYTLGLEFVAVGDLCSGGWVYTGPGSGWSGFRVYLFDAVTHSQLATLLVPTGSPETAYPFDWPAGVSITPGHHYIIALDKPIGSVYPGNVDNAFAASGGFWTPVEYRYSAGDGVCPATTLGARVGIEPTVCNASGYCQFGTRLKPGQSYVLVITEATIAALTIAVPELAFLEVAFGAFVGWTFVPGSLCNGPPPAMPVFTTDDFLFGTGLPSPGSIPKFWQAWQAGNWGLYCECLPNPAGIPPDPIPVPPPVVVPPPGAPPPPTPIGCDEADICTILDTMMRMLHSMSAQISYARADIQLIQRQHVPFGYVRSTVHAGLTGDGELAVSDLIGVEVVANTIPGWVGTEFGTPDELFTIGRISLGTVDGYGPALNIAHNPELMFPIDGSVTRIGYSLTPGVVATITELVREP